MSPDDVPRQGRLAHGLRQLQQRAPSAKRELPPELVAYLRALHAREGFINLFHAAVKHNRVPLQKIYASLAVDLALSVKVRDYGITDLWLRRAASDLDPPAGGPPVGDGWAQEETQLYARADTAALHALVGHVQQAIDAGADSEYDDPADRPLILAPPWYDGTKEQFWPLSACDAVALYKRIVLLGPPGSGKSTFMRYLALCLLGAQVEPPIPDAGLAQLGAWPHGPLIPVFVELRRLFAWEGFPGIEQKVTEDHFWNYVKARLAEADLQHVAPELRRELVLGRGLLLLDGLDEVPVPPGEGSLAKRRRQLEDLARELSTMYAASRIVLTTRDYAYRDWAIPGFEPVSLAPLEPKQARKLLHNLCQQRGLSGEQARTEVASMVTALEQVPPALKDYPLFLALMAAVYWQGEERRLPTQRSSLYQQSIELLLNRWAREERGEDSLIQRLGCDLDALWERLQRIAYETHKTADLAERGSSDIDFPTLAAELFRMGDDVDAHRVLAFLTQQAGVLVAREPEVFQFAHRGFQEYLAAAHLHRLFREFLDSSPQEPFGVVRRHLEENPLLWREPGVLLGDIVCRGPRTDDAWQLIESLLGEEPLPGADTGAASWWPAWLVARWLLEHDLHRGVRPRDRMTYERLRTTLIALLDAGALPVSERVDSAMALGLIGDTRPGVARRDGVPDIAWCAVPAGEFTMGTPPEQMAFMERQEWASGWAFSRETPAFRLWLPEFRISRYPVTRAQFAAFVDDPDGYADPSWWTAAGRAWLRRPERLPRPDRDTAPNLPQTSVCWYEADAFCAWLSSKLHQRVRLPTEAEWEKAARGTDGRLFPWGDDFDVRQCNTNVSGMDRLVPVGCYRPADPPWPDAPLDMSGNVWEWCSTISEQVGGDAFGYPYAPDDGREDPEPGDGHYRVVRGGSYWNPPFLVRAAYRGRDRPNERMIRCGFRVVLGA